MAAFVLMFSSCGNSGNQDGGLTPDIYTVIFDSLGGSPVPDITVYSGSAISEPGDPDRSGCIFGGWYREKEWIILWDFDADTVTGDITLFAKWSRNAEADTFLGKLGWVLSNPESNIINKFELLPGPVESIDPQFLFFPRLNNITIQVTGIGAAYIIELLSTGVLFTVNDGIKLILDDNITLIGKAGNTGSLVKVNSGGQLVMNEGSIIAGNGFVNGSGGAYGGGVYIGGDGTFTMNGGEIYGNSVSASGSENKASGGGVYAATYGIFTMNGGEIYNNTFSSDDYENSGGGGVFIDADASFTMNNGEIHNNEQGVFTFGTFAMKGGKICGNTHSGNYAAGVRISGGTFNMECGEISANNAVSGSYGGGLYITNATFDMSGTAKINNNTISNTITPVNARGGGVYVSGGAVINMTGGEISGNEAAYGGGVYLIGGSLTMSGGEISINNAVNGGGVCIASAPLRISGTAKISGNKASANGGGVYRSSGSLTMEGGEISGNKAYDGGGVYFFSAEFSYGNFTMYDGEISLNTAGGSGGGLFIDKFTGSDAVLVYIWDGIISGNKAGALYGGGIYVSATGTFIKYEFGGIIYGYDSGDPENPLWNKVMDGSTVFSNRGSAAYWERAPSPARFREITVAPDQGLATGSGAGWVQ